MEGEVGNFIKLWAWVIGSLCYCHLTGKVVPKGRHRLLAILPVVVLFLFLPLSLSSVILAGLTSFTIAWLANFKLLLFAFGRGPLAVSQPSLSLNRFIALASLPIQIRTTNHNSGGGGGGGVDPPKMTEKGRVLLNYGIMGLLLGLLFQAYQYTHRIHPNLLLLLYCLHMYLCLEIYLGLVAALVHSLLKLELEPQFNKPYLSTSLQDFWGRRWNLMVTSILRPVVYHPVRRAASPLTGRDSAIALAVLATFGVSALMHELIYYYLARMRPTWEITWFFLLHGVCVTMEGKLKNWWYARTKWRLPRLVSTVLTLGFLLLTCFWLFFPQLIRYRVDERGLQEFAAVCAFFKDVALGAPLLNATTDVVGNTDKQML